MWYQIDPLFDPSDDYGNVICCYSDKHVELRIKSKDWFVILRFGNQNHIWYQINTLQWIQKMCLFTVQE
jgi:hypothetical protein